MGRRRTVARRIRNGIAEHMADDSGASSVRPAWRNPKRDYQNQNSFQNTFAQVDLMKHIVLITFVP
jgi:hypothetical protein